MSGTITAKDGVAECFARIALDDGGGKWAPGAVLEFYPLDHKFERGDFTRFLILRVKLSEGQIADAVSRKLMIALPEIIADAKPDLSKAVDLRTALQFAPERLRALRDALQLFMRRDE